MPSTTNEPGAPLALTTLSPGERLLRLPAVLELTGRGRTAVLDDVKAGRFPRPIKVGAASMWLHSECQAWIAERVRASREVAK
jgi:prophage regulatory protein